MLSDMRLAPEKQNCSKAWYCMRGGNLVFIMIGVGSKMISSSSSRRAFI